MQGKTRRTVMAASILLIIFGLLFTLFIIDQPKEEADKPGVFVGVDVAYGDENVVYTIANAVSGYANLIVMGSLNVTQDTAALTRVC